MFWPCETRTSICRNLATISSGLYRFLAITVLLDVKDIPQVGPLQWGWITFSARSINHVAGATRSSNDGPPFFSIASTATVYQNLGNPLLVPKHRNRRC